MGDAGEQPMGHYLALLRRIHEHLRPRTYVEIGVRHGDSLAMALPNATVVGIDPAPSGLRPIAPGARIFTETSDHFFAHHDLGKVLGGHPVDLAFIDGMHLFEFALRDLINLERWCTPTSVVLVHDCLPVSESTAQRSRTTAFWSGDVWKLPLCLAAVRPDLEVVTVDVAPTGLGLIGRLDPSSTVLARGYAEISSRYINLGFDASRDRSRAAANHMPDDWPRVRSLLSRWRRGPRAA